MRLAPMAWRNAMNEEEIAMPFEIQAWDDVVEIARLTNKIPLLIRCFRGLVPGVSNIRLSQMKAVLEVACGPGVWMQEFAHVHQHIEVTGIDTRATMVYQARERFKEQHLSDASALLVSSYTKQLPFDDASFDLVSMQFVSLLVRVQEWDSLLKECQRVLRPGGIIRITEYELAQSNAPAHEQWSQLCWQAHKHLGTSPSFSHRFLGWFCELEPLVTAIGFQECASLPHVVNYAYGTPYHEAWMRDFNLQVSKYLPLMIEIGLIGAEQSVLLQQRIQQEMNLPHFHAIQFFLTVLGKKVPLSHLK